MRYERDGFSVQAAVAKGRELPEWYLEGEPQIDPTDSFYLRAFGELDTERQSGFGLGPIPHSKIVAYGERAGLCTEMQDVLVIVIRKMDETYRKWHDREAERTAKQKAGNIGNKTTAR